jgi:hypothetical protein
LNEAKKKNYHLKYPDLKRSWANQKFITPELIEQFISDFDSVMMDLSEETAVAIQNTKKIDKPTDDIATKPWVPPGTSGKALELPDPLDSRKGPSSVPSTGSPTTGTPGTVQKPAYEELEAEIKRLRAELSKLQGKGTKIPATPIPQP